MEALQAREALQTASLVEQCTRVVGAKNIVTDPAMMVGYLTDWTGEHVGDALAVARPSKTDEVAALVKTCADAGVAIVPQGGRTGLAGGGVPCGDRPTLIISLERMSTIRSIDLSGRTVVAEAGVVLESLQAAMLEHGLVFPLMFGAKGSCLIGGNLSTNAGGSNVVKYGNTRDLCLGIEAVLPDGTVLNGLSGLHKDNTGYDLTDLLIGAEGTLGIITAAVLKLVPPPTARATAFLSLRSLGDALKTLNAVQDRTGGAVEAFEFMPQPVLETICAAFPQTKLPLTGPVPTGILIEVASTRPSDAEPVDDGGTRLQSELLSVLTDQMEEGAVLDAVLATSERQRDELWRMRESVLESITHAGPAYHFDLSLPLDAVASFVEQMDSISAEMGFRPLTIGHLGDGNLHYALSAPDDADFDALPLAKAKSAALDLLNRFGGSFSAEHGIGQSKLGLMRALKDPVQLDTMRTIKKAIDPENIMNPGKLIPTRQDPA